MTELSYNTHGCITICCLTVLSFDLLCARAVLQYTVYPVLSYSCCVILRAVLPYEMYPLLSYSLLCDSDTQSCLTTCNVSSAVLQSVV